MTGRAQIISLTDGDTHMLRAYAAGQEIPAIAEAVGRTREKVGLRLATLCNLNRSTARALLAEPPATRPRGNRMPEARRAAILRDLPAELQRAATQPQVRTPEAQVATTTVERTSTAGVVARYGATWCDHCRYCGPAADHQPGLGCDPYPVDIVITRRSPA